MRAHGGELTEQGKYHSSTQFQLRRLVVSGDQSRQVIFGSIRLLAESSEGIDLVVSLREHLDDLVEMFCPLKRTARRSTTRLTPGLYRDSGGVHSRTRGLDRQPAVGHYCGASDFKGSKLMLNLY